MATEGAAQVAAWAEERSLSLRDMVRDIGLAAEKAGLDGLTELSAGIRLFMAEKMHDQRYFDGAVVYMHPDEIEVG